MSWLRALIIALACVCLLGWRVVSAQEGIQQGATIVDFEGEYEKVTGILTFPEGVEFFDAWVETADFAIESGFMPASGSHLLMGSGRFGIYAYFDQSVTGEVSSVGGFFSGVGGVLTAYDKNGNILGEAKTACCDFVLNQRLFVESKYEPIYLVIFSRKVSYSRMSIDDFFFISQKEECKIDLPLYMQTDPKWKDDRYGQLWWSQRSPYRTIEYEGCAVTSSAMVLSYYGRSQNGFSVDPSMLNSWLRDQPAGYVGGSVNWFSVARYAREVMGINLWYRGRDSKDGQVLSGRLCSGEPMILELDGHFVVAKGLLGDSWTINDPLNKSSVLSQYYGNWFKSTRRFSLDEKDSRGVNKTSYLIIDSNAEFDFHVVLPTGEVIYSSGDSGNVELEVSSFGGFTLVVDSEQIAPDATFYVALGDLSGAESLHELKVGPYIEFYFDGASKDSFKVVRKLHLPVVSSN